jgi:heme/copper-type cytochrome/quinol oxidase subunit 1
MGPRISWSALFALGAVVGEMSIFIYVHNIYISARRNLNDDSSLGARTLAKMSFNAPRESKREEASVAVDLQPPPEVVEYLDKVKIGAYIYMVGTS